MREEKVDEHSPTRGCVCLSQRNVTNVVKAGYDLSFAFKHVKLILLLEKPRFGKDFDGHHFLCCDVDRLFHGRESPFT